MKPAIVTFLSLTVLAISSCKKIENALNDTATNGSITATVDGRSYTAGKVNGAGSTATKIFSVKGSAFSNDEELYINIYNYTQTTGKYILGSGLNSATYVTDRGVEHISVSGELDLESTGENSAKGTFHFDAESGVKVTDGKFEVKWN